MEPLPRIRVILLIVVPVTIVTLILLLLTGCTKRALVRDCQKLEGTPWLNCEIVEEL